MLVLNHGVKGIKGNTRCACKRNPLTDAVSLGPSACKCTTREAAHPPKPVPTTYRCNRPFASRHATGLPMRRTATPNCSASIWRVTTHCAACHRRGDAGGSVGPSLDGLTARGLGRVVEDILDPGRNVDPLFRMASVTLRDGEVRSGFNPRRDASGVTLADVSTGRDFRIASGEIARFEPSSASAMPAGFENSLPERDFHDLLAFLLGP